MNATLNDRVEVGGASDEAKERLLSIRGEPLFYSDWMRALFIHFEVDPEALQKDVPFELDLHEGKAYMSLVAFMMRDLKPVFGGKFTQWLFKPIATHGLLNVRTYVKHNGESGIYFLSEWIPNRLSTMLGPGTFGLPYRLGRLCYEHYHEKGRLHGMVTTRDEGELEYEGRTSCATGMKTPGENLLEEFLVERYTAFTSAGAKRRFFRIWHPPWERRNVEVRVTQDSLLLKRWKWFKDARLVGATYSPGVENVWMGRPHLIA